MKTPRLTKAQWALLCGIVDGNIRYAVATYKPRQALEAMGLIRVDQSWRDTLAVTNAGMELVRNMREGDSCRRR